MAATTDLRRSLRALLRRTYVAEPPVEVYERVGEGFLPGHATYSQYNYLGGGPVRRVKSAHFEAALDLARGAFGTTGAIDFGTADGFLLPTLSRRFLEVLAIDDNAWLLGMAERAAGATDLRNIAFLCNAGMGWAEVRERIDRERFGVLFLLETLEHVGAPEDMVGSRVAFLAELFRLIRPDGTIVVSVPNMVGLPFAVQRAVLAATGGVREPISAPDLARAVVLKDVDRLEPAWDRTKHLGFSHRKLERAMREHFHVVGKRDLVFSKVYALRAA